jgi:hypothetical protein
MKRSTLRILTTQAGRMWGVNGRGPLHPLCGAKIEARIFGQVKTDFSVRWTSDRFKRDWRRLSQSSGVQLGDPVDVQLGNLDVQRS